MRARLRRSAVLLPRGWQQELRRARYATQLRRGSFRSGEPEFRILERWVRPGDLVLDVGANVGHYTARLSDLVGPEGHVIAIEPVLANAALLAANAERLRHRNVSVLQIAAAESAGLPSIAVPTDADGIPNYYRAALAPPGAGATVLALPLDALLHARPVAFVKVDVEGVEAAALRGMRRLIERDRPVLMVEGEAEDVAALLGPLGYRFEQLPGSPNRVFSAAETGAGER